MTDAVATRSIDLGNKGTKSRPYNLALGNLDNAHECVPCTRLHWWNELLREAMSPTVARFRYESCQRRFCASRAQRCDAMSHVEVPEDVEVLCVYILDMSVPEVCGTSAHLAADMSQVDSRFFPGFGAAALQELSD